MGRGFGGRKAARAKDQRGEHRALPERVWGKRRERQTGWRGRKVQVMQGQAEAA